MDKEFNEVIKIGISQCINSDCKYFTQFVADDKIYVKKDMPDIYNVLSIIVDPQIISLSVIDTIQGTSYEGQNLYGKKLLAKLKIKEKVMYAAKNREHSIHILERSIYSNAIIVIPNRIQGSLPEKLLKLQYITVTPYVEDIVVKLLDSRKIMTNVYLFIKVDITPTYELCYSFSNQDYQYNLFLCYEDGSRTVKKTSYNSAIIKKPQYGFNGQDVAYMVNQLSQSIDYELNIVNIKTGQINNFMFRNEVGSILDFMWIDHKSILIRADKVGKENLYIWDTAMNSLRHLTFTSEESTFPHMCCGMSKEFIVFTKCKDNIFSVFLTDYEGIELKKICEFKDLLEVNFYDNDNKILFIERAQNDYDLISMDIKTTNRQIIGKINLDDIKMCKCHGDNLAFVSQEYDKDDIYVFNLKNSMLTKITNHDLNVRIGDLIWHVDGGKLFYTCNELEFFNIYSLELQTQERRQLTNTNAMQISMTYRSKII